MPTAVMSHKQFPPPKFSQCKYCRGAGVREQGRFGWFYRCNLCKEAFSNSKSRKLNRASKEKEKKEVREKKAEIKAMWDSEVAYNLARIKAKGWG